MDNEQEQEKQELQWGEARAQMRITLEIFFVEGGIKLHVKSGKDDILSDNKSVYFIRRMVCEKLGKAVDNIVRDVCKAASSFAYIMKDSTNPEVAEAAADIVDLFGLNDEQDEDED
jgi:hypothetical protein